MNVQNAEMQAKGQAVQQMFTTVAGRPFRPFDPKISHPRTDYEYLGFYIFTPSQAEGLDAMMRSEILSYFFWLPPLPLTLSEQIQLVNSQLNPAVTYRLRAHPLPPQAVASLEDFVWRGLAKRFITRLVSLKDRYASRARGGLAIKSLAHNIHTATLNFALRVLHGKAPPSVVASSLAPCLAQTGTAPMSFITQSGRCAPTWPLLPLHPPLASQRFSAPRCPVHGYSEI